MMSIMMDAHKQRDVATADVAGACLHASLDEFTLPKWKEHQPTSWVTFPRSTRNLWHAKMARHLCLLKALHGCVKSALLWHELFTGTLAEMGFELNPHDTCAANKLVDGKQCTIHWCIDDNDTSHVDPQVVTDVVEKIEERFGKMTLPRGKKHDAFQQQGQERAREWCHDEAHSQETMPQQRWCFKIVSVRQSLSVPAHLHPGSKS
jgi:hypothetical protein